MSAPAPTRADDLRLLELLYVACKEGTPVAREQFGTTNSAIQGHKARTFAVRPDRDPWQCESVKPENRDGGMPERWWK